MTAFPSLTELSSCLSRWLLVISRGVREVVFGEGVEEDENHHHYQLHHDHHHHQLHLHHHHHHHHQNEGRTKRGKRGVSESKNNLMDDIVGSMPITLSEPKSCDEELQSEVWRNLSDELVDKVLARLPVPKLLQLQSVCKGWKERIRSPYFLKLRTCAPYAGPHFVVFKPQNLKSFGAYDAHLEKWYTIPLRGLDGYVVQLSSDGGLLCIVMRPNGNWYSGPTSILLYNPVINSEVLTLPSSWVGSQIEAWIPSLVVLVVDQRKKSFKLVAAGCKGNAHGPECLCSVTEVYYSTTQKWERTGNLPWNCNSYDFASHVVCGGHLFCIATGFGDPKLMDYDIERKEWKFFPLPHVGGAQGMLFERSGALMLVQLERGSHGVPEIYSWRPGSGRVPWLKVPTALPKLAKKIEGLFPFDSDLAWGAKGDLVFFVSQKWDRAVLYDLGRRECFLTPVSKFLKVDPSVLQAMPFDFDLQLLSS